MIKLIVVEVYSTQAADPHYSEQLCSQVDKKSVQVSEFVWISEPTDYIWRLVHLL